MSTKTKESKKIATYSLMVMGAGFIATIPFQGSFWIDLLQGGFEAGLVGGLAVIGLQLLHYFAIHLDYESHILHYCLIIVKE